MMYGHYFLSSLPGQLEELLAESEEILGDIATAIRDKVQKVSMGEIYALISSAYYEPLCIQ